MRKHPVSKFIGLTVLYTVIIVGIFVIQFKTESIISKNIGGLLISLSQTEDENGNRVMKNQFQIEFKGLTFTGDGSNPAYLTSFSEETEPLILESYTEPNELSIVLNFIGGTTLTFSTTDDTPEADLYIHALIPEGYKALTLQYKMDKTITIDTENQAENRVVTLAKENLLALTAATVTPGSLTITKTEPFASYLPFDPTKRFTFELLADLEGNSESRRAENISMLKSRVISLTNQLLNSPTVDSLSEQLAVAYIAEMADTGRLVEALNSIPETFKRGNKRTYVSSPYFNNLANMNRSLVVETDRFSSIIQSAINDQNLDIFSVDGITDYILREKRTSVIRTLLTFPGRMESFEPNLSQITGILHVYTQLNKKDQALASLMENIVDPCLELLLEWSSLEDDTYILAGKEELTFAQKITLGNALIEISQLTKEEDSPYVAIKNAGLLVFNGAIEEEGYIDLKALAEVYPLIASDNTYYPHTEILGYYGTRPVWAWTVANSISYKFENTGTVDIEITYPQDQINHIIFNGIPNFNAKIEIQHIMFRTDPRFENYNSSGYVYQTDTETLFIKSRHKSQVELIRLFCAPATNFTGPDTPYNKQ